MKRIIPLVWFVVGWQLGCADSRPSGRRVHESPPCSPPVALADYLRTQDVAGLQSLHMWPNRFGRGRRLNTRAY